MKKMLLLLLAVFLMLPARPVAVRAEEATYELTYEETETGLTITGFTGTAQGDLTIPVEIDGMPVTAVANEAFAGAEGFDGTLTIGQDDTDGSENYLTTIGYHAFTGVSVTKIVNFTEVTFALADIIPMDSPNLFVNEEGTEVEEIGRGIYTLKVVEPFDLQFAQVDFYPQYYDGTPKIPDFIVYDGDRVLSGYEVTSITNNINAGIATAVITAIEGNKFVKGSYTFGFAILPALLVDNAVIEWPDSLDKISEVKVTWNGRVLEPETEYVTAYFTDDNGQPGISVNGVGNFTGEFTKIYEWPSLAKATFKVSSKTYTGAAFTPEPTVKLGDTVLVKDTDYTISYKNNVNAGQATVIIQGIGQYTGTAEKTFTIKPRSIKKVKIAGMKTLTYTGKALTQKLTLTYNGMTLKKGRDYTLLYKNSKKAGKASVTITGKGNYTGKVTKYYKIRPAKSGITQVTNPSKGKVKVVWNKSASADGYQLQISSKKDFKTSRKVFITKRTKVKTSFSKLKAGKTYYVRLRVYKRVDGKKIYSDWCKVRKIKVTK